MVDKLNIEKIRINHLDNLVELFLSCFKDDWYYKRIFPNESTRLEEMRLSFLNPIKYCIVSGDSFGFFDAGKVVAFHLTFDYKKTKLQDPIIFGKIFKGDDVSIALPYKAEFHDKIEFLKGDILYLLSVGVHEDYRGQGLSSKLLEYTIAQYPKHFLVTDISSEVSLNTCTKYGFSIEEIGDYYFFAKRAPIERGDK